MYTTLNAFTTGNPFWGHFYLEISIGRVLGALKGLKSLEHRLLPGIYDLV